MIPSVYDIVWLGDSLTSDRVGNWQNSFRQRMQSSKLCSIKNYDGGIPGDTSAQGLARAAFYARLKPKAAVIAFGMNDAPPSSGISVAQFKTNVTAAIDTFKAASDDTDIFLMTMNPVVVPPGSSTNAAVLPSYYQGLRDLAVSEDVGLIDVYPLWAGSTSEQIPDGVHPTITAENAVLIPKLLTVFLPLV